MAEWEEHGQVRWKVQYARCGTGMSSIWQVGPGMGQVWPGMLIPVPYLFIPILYLSNTARSYLSRGLRLKIINSIIERHHFGQQNCHLFNTEEAVFALLHTWLVVWMYTCTCMAVVLCDTDFTEVSINLPIGKSTQPSYIPRPRLSQEGLFLPGADHQDPLYLLSKIQCISKYCSCLVYLCVSWYPRGKWFLMRTVIGQTYLRNVLWVK